MASTTPYSYMTSRAAGVVVSRMNYDLGRPHRIYEHQQVSKSSMKSIEGEGNTYHLEFQIKDVLNEKPPIPCTADVLYYTNKNTAPKVTYNLQTKPENYTAAQDKTFYNRMKGLTEPLTAGEIPDNFGTVAPDMKPILHLAQAACGLVKCENSTEETFYRMTVIKRVQQVIRDAAAVELHFHMLIHENVSQEMESWFIEVLWDPSEGLRVKNYHRLPKINPDENNS
ncbi:latexin [Leptodactylus fuscus]|uniref:latexin n=1 Tax=Leptodactylus fuscus TaxID=238119 RepID=UPI003F4F09F8